jgi:hypothetical protein
VCERQVAIKPLASGKVAADTACQLDALHTVMSAIGTKRTLISTLNMSAFRAKRTSLIGWPMSAQWT